MTFGKKIWIIPGGRIPVRSTGKEPELLSQDRIAVLNTGSDTANIKITVYYGDEEPVSCKPLEVQAGRLRKIRINDLIDPFPVFLERDYALVIESDRDIIVQFLRMNTGQNSLAIMGTIGFGTG